MDETTEEHDSETGDSTDTKTTTPFPPLSESDDTQLDNTATHHHHHHHRSTSLPQNRQIPSQQNTTTTKSRPSLSSSNIPNVSMQPSHFSKPIEIPPDISVGLRLDSITTLPDIVSSDLIQPCTTDNNTKRSISCDRRDISRNSTTVTVGGTNALKKQITKFSKMAGAGRQRKQVKDGQVVFKGHRNWEIVLSIQHGLKYTAEILESKNEIEPNDRDFAEKLSFDFNPDDGQTGGFQSKLAKWVHPAPRVFKAIRRKFNISEIDFLHTMCSGTHVRELPTPGKSGALFYITDDENFFIKTIQRIEERMLMSMLPSYYRHISNHPNTFLTKYMAYFRVRTGGDRHIRLIVMASIFDDQICIDRKYDLKGSTYKRLATPKQLESANVTLKDQDFHQPIFFRPDVVKKIVNQLRQDSAFLESHQVMDYSLLLGVSDIPNEGDTLFDGLHGADEENAPYFVGFQRGPSGEKVGVRVCMGIIDFLQRFRVRKKLEYGLRALQSCSARSASVVPPHIYRERFMTFLESKLLADPDYRDFKKSLIPH